MFLGVPNLSTQFHIHITDHHRDPPSQDISETSRSYPISFHLISHSLRMSARFQKMKPHETAERIWMILDVQRASSPLMPTVFFTKSFEVVCRCLHYRPAQETSNISYRYQFTRHRTSWGSFELFHHWFLNCLSCTALLSSSCKPHTV